MVDDYVHREAAAQIAELCIAAGHPERIANYLRTKPFLALVREELEAAASETGPTAVKPAPADGWAELRAINTERFASHQRPAR